MEHIATDRARLVRFCAYLTRDPEAAEDLAQETLLVAWQHGATLRDPAVYDAWLMGIARNMTRRWARRRGRDRARLTSLGPADADTGTGQEGEPVDACDLEATLQQADLDRLLARALDRLPPATRQVLVARYLAGQSQAAVAQRLNLTEGAVEARVQRGKRPLLRLLNGELQAEAAAYDLPVAPAVGWQSLGRPPLPPGACYTRGAVYGLWTTGLRAIVRAAAPGIRAGSPCLVPLLKAAAAFFFLASRPCC